jgi:O-antigen/teichoic acid export membrane protein
MKRRTAPQERGLRQLIVSGLVWKGASQFVLQSVRLGLAVVLAHLLTPHDYGIAGMVLVFATFVIPFADVGLGAALVQRRTLREIDICTVFWTSLAAGTFFTGVGIAAAGLVAHFYDEPAVKPLFATLSISFFVTALSATHRSLLVREIRFRSLEIRLLVSTAVAVPLAICTAALGYGPWAFIVLELAMATTSTLLLWILVPWRPSFSFSLASLRRLAGFGVNTLGARFFLDINQIADKLLVGRFLGAAPLGAYALSYNVVLSPFSRIVGPLQEVFFPAFARMQDDPTRMTAAWLRVNRVVAAIATPATLGLVAVAPDFVDVVLGRRWHEAIRVIEILAWVGLLVALQGVNQSVLQARDRTSDLFRFTLVSFLLNLVGFVIGLHWGIVGVATAYAITTTALTPVYVYLAANALSCRLGPYLRGLAGIVQASVGMFVIVLGVRYALLQTELAPALRLAATISVGAAAFLALARWRAPVLLEDVRSVRRRGRLAAGSPDPSSAQSARA